MQKEQHTFDIAIVGAGMVGATLALSLAARTSLRILIVDREKQCQFQARDAYQPRVSAIAIASKKLLQHVAVWEAIQQTRVGPFKQIKVWDADGAAQVSFDAQEVATSVLGYIVENELIQSCLQDALLKQDNVMFLPETELRTVEQNSEGVLLQTADNEYHANLCVAADGGKSWVRQQVGISVKKQPYNQHAIVTTVTTEKPHEATARQVFLETGPLAFLPLKESSLSSIVWSMPSEEVQTYLDMSDADFCAKLTSVFSNRLGKVTACDKRFAFPLAYQQAECYVKNRIVLVGDAAHTMHPLAGQGVNVGLQDVACLVELLSSAKSITDERVLRRYQRMRRAENAYMLNGVNALNTLFLTENAAIKSLRTFGMQMTDKSTWLKKTIMRFAVGV